jgi:alkylhydroperoxidase family enzyme
VVRAVLADWRTAPVPERLRAILGFLETLTLRPSEVTPQTVRDLRNGGLSDDAIREAIYVCFLYNLQSRLSDAFAFEMPDRKGMRRTGRVVRRVGYWASILPG